MTSYIYKKCKFSFKIVENINHLYPFFPFIEEFFFFFLNLVLHLRVAKVMAYVAYIIIILYSKRNRESGSCPLSAATPTHHNGIF